MVDVLLIGYIVLVVLLIIVSIKFFKSLLATIVTGFILLILLFALAYLDIVRTLGSYSVSNLLVGVGKEDKIDYGFVVNMKNKAVYFLNYENITFINENIEDLRKIYNKTGISFMIIFDNSEDVLKEIVPDKIELISLEGVSIELSKGEALDILTSNDPIGTLENLIYNKYGLRVNVTSLVKDPYQLKAILLALSMKNVRDAKESVIMILKYYKEGKLYIYPKFWWLGLVRILPYDVFLPYLEKLVSISYETTKIINPVSIISTSG